LSALSAAPARPRFGVAQICLAGVLWGTGGLAVQLIRRHAPLSPLTISGYRSAIAALVLVAVALASGRRRQVGRLVRTHPARVAVVGVLTASYQLLYFGAVVAVGVSVSTVVALGLAPVLLSAADALRGRRRPPAGDLLTLGAALAGLVLVAAGSGDGSTGPHPVLGVLAAAGSGATYAAAARIGEPLAARADPLVLATAATCFGALALAPVAAVLGVSTGAAVATAQPAALAWLGYLGAVTMALAYGLLYAGLRTTPARAAVLATLLEPVTAAVAATVVLGEHLGAPGIAGAVLILLALASLGRAAKPVATPPP
jgi:DME family drug/metabolite transporter